MEYMYRAVPVLASLNIEKSVRFYKEKLGFDKLRYQNDDYAVLGRDRIEIHFWKCRDKIHPENTSCYIKVKNIDDLYTEMKKQNVVHPNGKLEDKPWNIREFAILDKDGNMIKFGQEIS